MEQFSHIYEFFNQKNEGTVRQLVWCKTNPSVMNGKYVYLSSTENAVWFKKHGTGKLNGQCVPNYINAPLGSGKYHPTEKNHKLLRDIIEVNTREGDLVVDTCMGSGSCGIVCKAMNRDFFGIELDKNFFDIAKQRIEYGDIIKDDKQDDRADLW